MSTVNYAGSGAPRVEHRSIDHVPAAERHGKAWHQAPFWFNGGAGIPSLLAGFVGPELGLGLWASLAAVALGIGFGTLVMALHANQGPKLGLPQMIQSRAQFGSRGAIFPMLVAVFIYVGYNVFGIQFAGEAANTLMHGEHIWYIVFGIVGTVVAVYGHDLLHKVMRYAGYATIMVFAVLTIVAISHFAQHGGHTSATHFSWSAFLIQFAVAGGYQVSYAIYVSDYTRYLPASTPTGPLIGWTFLGGFAGAGWIACLGTLFAHYGRLGDPFGTLKTYGDMLFSGFGDIVVLCTLLPLVGTVAVNAYGATLTTESIIDGLRPVRPTVRLRVTTVILLGILSGILTFVIKGNSTASFNTFLTIMGYLLVPWTAVNLVDYYLVRRGHYSIADIMDRDGIYGHWPWRGLLGYFGGFAVMIPFFSLSFYTGPLVHKVGGADISFIVGLVASALIYVAAVTVAPLRQEPSLDHARATGAETLAH